LLLSLLDKSILIDAGEPCSRSLAEAERAVRTVWPQFYPNSVLDSSPAKDVYAVNYADDARLARLLALSTLITLSIAAFGVYVLAADAVVTGVGVRPSTDWLIGSGLELLPALAVDEHLRSTSDAHVYALGDTAAWWSRRYARRLNVQHWDDAYASPSVVAAGIVHGADSDLVHDPVPYFWSDQFGHRVEYVGHHDPSDEVTVDEDHEQGWTARWTNASGHLTAALAVDQSKLIAAIRADLLAPAGI